MTLLTTKNSVSYNGLTGQDTFAYTFRVDDQSDMIVTLDDVGTTDFTMTGIGNAAGGNVILNVPLVADLRVALVRIVAATQEVDYQPFDAFPAETHEAALDKLTMLAQQNGDAVTRSLRLPEGDTANVVYPETSLRANKFAYFDANGNASVIEADPDPVSLRSINISADSDTMLLVDYQTVDALNPLIGMKNINGPTGVIQLTTAGKLPAGLIDFVGIRTLGAFRGDDLCDKPGDDPGDCIPPDSRNPSERIPAIIPVVQNGDYFILTFKDLEIDGMMNLYTNVGDALPAVIPVFPRDGVMWLDEVLDPNDSLVILIQAGWYHVPKLVEVGNAADITYDDTGKVYLNPAVNVQVALDLTDAEFVERDAYFTTQKNTGRLGLAIPGNNLNNITQTGFYYADSAALNTPIAGEVFSIEHIQLTSIRATQFAIRPTADGSMYMRRLDTAWAGWIQIFTELGGTLIGNLVIDKSAPSFTMRSNFSGDGSNWYMFLQDGDGDLTLRSRNDVDGTVYDFVFDPTGLLTLDRISLAVPPTQPSHATRMDFVQAGDAASVATAATDATTKADAAEAAAVVTANAYTDSRIPNYGSLSADGLIFTGPAGWTGSQLGVGQYRITHNLALVDPNDQSPIIIPVAANITHAVPKINVLGANSFDFVMEDASGIAESTASSFIWIGGLGQ